MQLDVSLISSDAVATDINNYGVFYITTPTAIDYLEKGYMNFAFANLVEGGQ